MLAAATRLGPYEIVAALGAGGMGEVYRAKDTRLGRDVAIKVLPAEFAGDSERLRRFEQEAKAVSALNHPHIVTLYEVGTSAHGPYLVLEKIDGQSLRELLRSGALPVKRVLTLGAQIAEGLAKAHAAGIVHRDLKPENVMVTDDGFAKILDFGLAKLVYPELEASAIGNATTLAEKTGTGMIVGTLGYLSPEQAVGKPADFRSDQFALGALLYELATGERPFRRETVPESLTAVIREEPEPLRAKNAALPVQLGWIVERCLSKDPNDRYGSTKDLARDLADLGDHLSEVARGGPSFAAPQGRLSHRRERFAWALAAAGLLAALALALLGPRAKPPVRERIVSALLPAEGSSISVVSELALSPDGRMVVFSDENTSELFVRTLDEPAPRILPGTTRGFLPFWSPDSREIGFFRDSELLRIGVEAAQPTLICELGESEGRGASWGSGGVILVGIKGKPLQRVTASGGTLVDALSFDAERGERDHRAPSFLPDGKRFLYATGDLNLNRPHTILLGSLDGAPSRPLFESHSSALFAPPDAILSAEPNGTLLARRLDLATNRLTGEPQRVAERVIFHPVMRILAIGVSGDGKLAYRSGILLRARFAWLDRGGRILERFGPSADLIDAALSSDGRRIVFGQSDPGAGFWDPWIYDIARDISRPLDRNPAHDDSFTWSPDGREIGFRSYRDGKGRANLFRKRVDDDSPPVPLVTSEREKYGFDWSPDGRYVAYGEFDSGERPELWIADLTGRDEPRRLHPAASWPEESPRFSPAGGWLAFQSAEAGRPEIFIEPFPQAGRRVQLSTQGAVNPMWSRSGREIYYFDLGLRKTVAVEIGPGSEPKLGPPRQLFGSTKEILSVSDLAPDDQRFLAIVTDPGHGPPPITLMQNWWPWAPR